MRELVKMKDDLTVKCTTCQHDMSIKSCVVKDTKPYKLITSMSCENCNVFETTEEDLTKLDFGVKISVEFNKENFEDRMQRMLFINTNAETYFYNKDSKLMFSFNSVRANVDCIEGLVLRGKEALLLEDSQELKELRDYFDVDIFKNHEFRIDILDQSGYSKICPAGVEYTEIMDMSLENINKINPEIYHEKIECLLNFLASHIDLLE